MKMFKLPPKKKLLNLIKVECAKCEILFLNIIIEFEI